MKLSKIFISKPEIMKNSEDCINLAGIILKYKLKHLKQPQLTEYYNNPKVKDDENDK